MTITHLYSLLLFLLSSLLSSRFFSPSRINYIPFRYSLCIFFSFLQYYQSISSFSLPLSLFCPHILSFLHILTVFLSLIFHFSLPSLFCSFSLSTLHLIYSFFSYYKNYSEAFLIDNTTIKLIYLWKPCDRSKNITT